MGLQCDFDDGLWICRVDHPLRRLAGTPPFQIVVPLRSGAATIAVNSAVASTKPTIGI